MELKHLARRGHNADTPGEVARCFRTASHRSRAVGVKRLS